MFTQCFLPLQIVFILIILNVGYVERPCVSFFPSFCQNATAWRCFTLSKQPVPVACEAPQQAGDLTPVSSSVMNHVMHGRYGEVGVCQRASAPLSAISRETQVYLVHLFEILQAVTP